MNARLQEATSARACTGLMEELLPDPLEPGIVQRACAWIDEKRGQVRMDQLAFAAGLSARQLRRLFLQQTGLTPKHLCRVIRFQHSLSELRRSRPGNWTQVALDCGYYDQAHFINEFREFSGSSPTEFLAISPG